MNPTPAGGIKPALLKTLRTVRRQARRRSDQHLAHGALPEHRQRSLHRSRALQRHTSDQRPNVSSKVDDMIIETDFGILDDAPPADQAHDWFCFLQENSILEDPLSRFINTEVRNYGRNLITQIPDKLPQKESGETFVALQTLVTTELSY